MVDTSDGNYYSKIDRSREEMATSISLPKVATGRNRGSAKRLWREHELVKIQTVLQQARESTAEDSGIAVPKFAKQFSLQPIHSVPMYKVLHAPSNFGTKNHDLRHLYSSAVNLVNEARNVEDRSSYKSLKSMHKIHMRGYTAPQPLSGRSRSNKIVWKSSARAMTCPVKFDITTTREIYGQKPTDRAANTPTNNKDEFKKEPTFLELYGKDRKTVPAASELFPIFPRLALSRKEERRIVKYAVINDNYPAEETDNKLNMVLSQKVSKEHDQISLGDHQSVRSYASSEKCNSSMGKSGKTDEKTISRASGKSVASSKGESERVVSIQEIKIDGNKYRTTPSVHIPIAQNASETDTQYTATEQPLTDLAETSSKIFQGKNKPEPAVEADPNGKKDQIQDDSLEPKIESTQSIAGEKTLQVEGGQEEYAETLINQTTTLEVSNKQDEDEMSKTEYTRNIDDAIPNTPAIPEERKEELGKEENQTTTFVVSNKQNEDGKSKTEYTRNIDDAIPNTPAIPEERKEDELKKEKIEEKLENSIDTKDENPDNLEVEVFPRMENNSEEKLSEVKEDNNILSEKLVGSNKVEEEKNGDH